MSALEHHLEALALLKNAEADTSPAVPAEDPGAEEPPQQPVVLPHPPPQAEPASNSEAETVAADGYAPFRDQVTGLHSREGFDVIAGGELKRCRRYGRVFSLALFHLPAADTATFRRAANAVAAATRESDLIGRHVDRTLAVALPETPPTEVRLVAERIIQHLEGVGAWDEECRVGLVTHPAHGETLLHLLDAGRAQLSQPTQQVLASSNRGVWPG